MIRKCCFAGHRDFRDNKIEEKFMKTIEELYVKENVSYFMVGNYGAFDRFCAHCVRKLKSKYDKITLELVVPYLTNEIRKYPEYYEDFDNILIVDNINTPTKYKIIKANRYMVDNSDFMLSYITHTWGGAYITFEYAKTKNLQIINFS